MSSAWSRFAPFIRVTPRYLRLALSSAEETAIEDALFDQLGIASLLDWRGPSGELFDLERGAGPLATVARAVVGRAPERLATVEGLVPFDWGPDGALRPGEIDRALQELPDLIRGPGPIRYFGADERTPPYLWTSFEAPGLQLGGVVEETAWTEWSRSFGERFASFPLRALR